MSRDERVRSYLRLTLADGVGAVLFARLAKAFGEPAAGSYRLSQQGECCDQRGLERILERVCADLAQTRRPSNGKLTSES